MEKKDSQDDSLEQIFNDFTRELGRPPTDLERQVMQTFSDGLNSSDSIRTADFSATVELLTERGTELEQSMRDTVHAQFFGPLTPEETNTITTAETKEIAIQRHIEVLERRWNRPLTEMQKLTIRNIWTVPAIEDSCASMIALLDSFRNL